MSQQKYIKKLMKNLRHSGWRIDDSGKHYQAYSPDGVSIITIARSPSCPFALKNIQAEIKRAERRADIIAKPAPPLRLKQREYA